MQAHADVQDDDLAEAKVAGDGASLRADALLEAAVAAEHVGVVIDERVALRSVTRQQIYIESRARVKRTGLLKVAAV